MCAPVHVEMHFNGCETPFVLDHVQQPPVDSNRVIVIRRLFVMYFISLYALLFVRFTALSATKPPDIPKQPRPALASWGTVDFWALPLACAMRCRLILYHSSTHDILQPDLLFGFECSLIIEGQRGPELKSLICQQCARHILPEII